MFIVQLLADVEIQWKRRVDVTARMFAPGCFLLLLILHTPYSILTLLLTTCGQLTCPLCFTAPSRPLPIQSAIAIAVTQEGHVSSTYQYNIVRCFGWSILAIAMTVV